MKMKTKDDVNLSPYDLLSLEIERANALSGHLEDRLSALSEGEGSNAELYALSVIAHELCEKHGLLVGKALVLHENRAKTGKAKKTGGAR